MAALGEDLHQIGCQIVSRKVNADYGVRERVALIDADCMRNAIARWPRSVRIFIN